jgi:hypothetical protein
VDWGSNYLGGNTKSWLEEMDEADKHGEIGLFGNVLMDFFQNAYEKAKDTVDSNR